MGRGFRDGSSRTQNSEQESGGGRTAGHRTLTGTIMRQPIDHAAPSQNSSPASPNRTQNSAAGYGSPHPGPQALDNGIVTEPTPVVLTTGEPREVTLAEGDYVEVLAHAGSNYRVRVPTRAGRECEIPMGRFRPEPEIRNSPIDPNRASSELHYARSPGQAFVGAPQTSDVRQGDIGDCYLLAAAMSVINCGQGTRLMQIIVPQGDGWQVTLHDIDRSQNTSANQPRAGAPATPQQRLVPWVRHIDNYFMENIYPGSDAHEGVQPGARGALWPRILEKAYAQMTHGMQALDGGGNGYLTGGEHAGDPARTVTAMMAITGRSATQHANLPGQPADGALGNMMGLPAGQLAPRLKALWLSGQPVSCGTYPTLTPEAAGLPDGSAIMAHHMYALGTVDDSNQIYLLNPYGEQHPPPLSEAKFRQCFQQVVVSAPTTSAAPRQS